MHIRLDHIVLTVASIKATCTFYRDVLDARIARFGDGRVALDFAGWKVNLHQAGREFEPKAARPAPGSADFCVITDEPLSRVIDPLHALHIAVEQAPVPRTGACGAIVSVYI